MLPGDADTTHGPLRRSPASNRPPGGEVASGSWSFQPLSQRQCTGIGVDESAIANRSMRPGTVEIAAGTPSGTWLFGTSSRWKPPFSTTTSTMPPLPRIAKTSMRPGDGDAAASPLTPAWRPGTGYSNGAPKVGPIQCAMPGSAVIAKTWTTPPIAIAHGEDEFSPPDGGGGNGCADQTPLASTQCCMLLPLSIANASIRSPIATDAVPAAGRLPPRDSMLMISSFFEERSSQPAC